MARASPLPIDTLIFGAGVAGLWLLEELRRAGNDAWLVESRALGAGQTVASQGIIHGGLKYTLAGAMTGSAESIRDMPELWRDCLAGRRAPDLRTVLVRSEHCYLWRTDSLRSRAGMIGARVGLRAASEPVPERDRPAPLRRCPGVVARVGEQVIDCGGLVGALGAAHRERVLRVDAEAGADFEDVGAVRLTGAGGAREATLAPRRIVITAGAGAAGLRDRLGLPAQAMQLRPLHMVMLRGDLPDLFGHCVDGARTRATITTARLGARRAVWQIGGQIAEDGVSLESGPLIARARRELGDILPGVDFGAAEWATYRVDRAEAATPGARRPEGASVIREGDVITAWPTKLALAPQLAERIAGMIGAPAHSSPEAAEALADWDRPEIAQAPWEAAARWTPDGDVRGAERV